MVDTVSKSLEAVRYGGKEWQVVLLPAAQEELQGM